MIDFEKIGKYKISGKLGQGSFGVVYQGRDAYLKRDVAIKVCSVEDEGLRKRFFREAEISGKLVHKNIVTVYDGGLEDDIPYLVQEMLSGEDLNRIVKRRDALAPADRLDYLLQVANGLGYAHTEGVIHRDIKPGNIRVLEDGRIKIMDFGIAKLASAETQLTQKGVTMGTASYLPPEQVRGAELDHRADIFSFGVLAYELMTYERPFKGNTLSALIYQILYKVPSPMSDVWPECPPPLSDLIAKCLEKKPERRHGSFADLIPELTNLREKVLAGKWPALQQAAVPPAAAPPSEPSDVVSQAAIAQTARGVLEGKVGDYTISTAASPQEILRPSAEAGQSTRPIKALPAEKPAAIDEALKTRIMAAQPVPAVAPAPLRGDAAPAPPPGDVPAEPESPATAPPVMPPPAAPSPVDVPLGEDSEELTIKAGEIIDLVAQGKLEAEAAKEQLEATFSRKDLAIAAGSAPAAQPGATAPEIPPPSPAKTVPLPAPGGPTGGQATRAPAGTATDGKKPAPDADKSDTYRTVFRPPLGRRGWAAIAAAVVAVATLGWLLFRGGGETVVETVEEPPPPVPVVQPTVAEPSLGAVTIEAAPWAQLTEITDARGYVQELPPAPQTPLYLELPPGQYKIRLQNPEGTEVQTCDVEVVLGTVASCAPAFPEPNVIDYFKETGWWP